MIPTLTLRDVPPPGDVVAVDALHPSVQLPMERPLFRPAAAVALNDAPVQAGDAGVDAAALFTQVRVDKAALAAHVRQALQTRTQVSLGELLHTRPLQQGLGELVAYLQLASVAAQAVVDEAVQETVHWTAADGVQRSATLPRVIFVRT